MNIIPDGYINSLCEVRGDTEEVYIVGRIGEITQDYIQIKTTSTLPLIYVNTPVKVQIYNEELGFCLLSALVYISSDYFIKITNTEIVTDKERRRFFRVPFKLETTACMINADGNHVKLQGEWFKISVENIGLGGIYFLSKKQLEYDDCIAVELLLTSGKHLNYKVVNMDTKEDCTGYGCSLVYTDNKTTDELCSHIFTWQRKLISEAKGNQ